uniref:Retrovirus-related Pol polyprotein from transposon TNT 1-94-like beta-barrel domain-containing protein n=1 Tax=Vitis vinifera TaxID=29760 RepID=A5AMB1_VITVI|nr:hypothetical protein VITISV_004967 [Vitis vinifera]
MMKTWSESEDESFEEEKEKEVANMCSMAIDELDEVKSNISYEDIHDAFEELYEDFEKLGLKNVSLKKKVQQLEKELREGSKKDKWFLDSGCSRHMTRDESKFAFLTKKNGGYVTFGDNAKGKIIDQGNIGNDTSSLIENVLLVDGLKHNLFKH